MCIRNWDLSILRHSKVCEQFRPRSTLCSQRKKTDLLFCFCSSNLGYRFNMGSRILLNCCNYTHILCVLTPCNILDEPHSCSRIMAKKWNLIMDILPSVYFKMTYPVHRWRMRSSLHKMGTGHNNESHSRKSIWNVTKLLDDLTHSFTDYDSLNFKYRMNP